MMYQRTQKDKETKRQWLRVLHVHVHVLLAHAANSYRYGDFNHSITPPDGSLGKPKKWQERKAFQSGSRPPAGPRRAPMIRYHEHTVRTYEYVPRGPREVPRGGVTTVARRSRRSLEAVELFRHKQRPKWLWPPWGYASGASFSWPEGQKVLRNQ